MEQAKFKTNIKCSGCIEKVTPGLNSLYGEAGWEVDLQSPDRILTVHASKVIIAEMQQKLAAVGYRAEPLSGVAPGE